MDVKKLQQRIKMKKTCQDEINESLKELSVQAREILIKNDEIFNSIKAPSFNITSNGFGTRLPCEIDFKTLNDLNNKLKPSKIILKGGAYDSTYFGNTSDEYIDLILFFD